LCRSRTRSTKENFLEEEVGEFQRAVHDNREKKWPWRKGAIREHQGNPAGNQGGGSQSMTIRRLCKGFRLLVEPHPECTKTPAEFRHAVGVGTLWGLHSELSKKTPRKGEIRVLRKKRRSEKNEKRRKQHPIKKHNSADGRGR